MMGELPVVFIDTDDIVDVLPEVEQGTTKEHLEILEDFFQSVCSSQSMEGVNDALAECVEARRGVA